METENNSALPFPDVLIKWNENRNEASIKQTPMFSGLRVNFLN